MSTCFDKLIGKYMTKNETINYFGSVKKLADALKIWPQSIYAWGKYPPISKQYEIEVKTNGKLKAEKTNE
jgi:hypothetical protein